MKIGFIGYGNMSSALIKGMISNNIDPQNITISNRTQEKIKNLKNELKVNIVTTNKECVLNKDIIFLGVKPFDIKEVLNEIKDSLNQNTILVSMAAGISIEEINKQVACKIVRIMPNTPCLVNEGTIAICANDQEALNIIKNYLKGVGSVFEIKENLFSSFIGIAGSAPAYVYMFIEALADGGVLEGLPRNMALELAAKTVYGSAKMVLQTKIHPAILKDNVCSPGGTTIHAVASLEKDNFRSSIINAVSSAANKDRGI